MRFGISSYNWSRAHIAGAQANLEPRELSQRLYVLVRRASRLVQFQARPVCRASLTFQVPAFSSSVRSIPVTVAS